MNFFSPIISVFKIYKTKMDSLLLNIRGKNVCFKISTRPLKTGVIWTKGEGVFVQIFGGPALPPAGHSEEW